MALLEINGHQVEVDDSFRSLSPDQQNATVDEIAKSLPKAASSAPPMSNLERKVGIGTEGFFKGVADTAGMPVDMLNAANKGVYAGANWLIDKATGALGAHLPDVQPQNIPVGGSKTFEGATDAMGLTGNPNLQPQTTGEKLLSAGAQGVGSAGLFGAGAGLDLLKSMIAGAGAGVGGEGAGLAVEANSHPWVRKMAPVARVIGAIGGAGLISGLTNTALRAYNLAKGEPVNDIYQAYKDEGITPSLAGEATGNPSAMNVEAKLSGVPGAGRINTTARKTIDDVRDALERNASNVGSLTTVQGAGDALQQGGNSYIKNFKQGMQTRSAVTSRFFQPTDRVSVANTDAVLSDMIQQMPDAPELAKSLQPGLLNDLYEGLQNSAAANGTLSYKSMRAFRTEIGMKLADPALMRDVRDRDLARLYGALSEDLMQAAQAKGPQAVKALQSENAFAQQGHEYIRNTLSNVVDSGVSPEKAYTWAMGESGKGGSRLQALRKAYSPDEWGQFSGVVMRKMGENSAGEFSPAFFFRRWNSMPDEAKTALLGGPQFQDARASMDRLARISEVMRDTQRMANNSNTGGTSFLLNVLTGGTLSGGGAVTGAMIHGAPGAAVGAVATPVAAMLPVWATSRLMTNPTFIRWLATPVGPGQIPAHLSRLSAVITQAPEIATEVQHFLAAVQGASGAAIPGSAPRQGPSNPPRISR